jgi:hypothetical protein
MHVHVGRVLWWFYCLFYFVVCSSDRMRRSIATFVVPLKRQLGNSCSHRRNLLHRHRLEADEPNRVSPVR